MPHHRAVAPRFVCHRAPAKVQTFGGTTLASLFISLKPQSVSPHSAHDHVGSLDLLSSRVAPPNCRGRKPTSLSAVPHILPSTKQSPSKRKHILEAKPSQHAQRCLRCPCHQQAFPNLGNRVLHAPEACERQLAGKLTILADASSAPISAHRVADACHALCGQSEMTHLGIECVYRVSDQADSLPQSHLSKKTGQMR